MSSSNLSGSNTNDGDGCSLYEQSNQTIFVMEAQHHRLIHALLAQLDYRQMLQKHRVLQLAETVNERVLKLVMTEIPFFLFHEEVGDLRGSPASSWITFLG